MPTNKPTSKLTLHPVNKNSKKRSRDEMSASLPPDDDMESVDGSADDAATPHPQDPPNRNSGGTQDGSTAGGGPATLPVPRRMPVAADGRSHAQRQVGAAAPQVRRPRPDVPSAGARQQVPGLAVRPAVPQAPAHVLPQPASQTDDYASIQGLRTQIIDNINVLYPYMVSPVWRQVFAAGAAMGDDIGIHIITLKQRDRWTAAWTFGPNYVVVRSAAAGSAVGALEKLLEHTSDLLVGI